MREQTFRKCSYSRALLLLVAVCMIIAFSAVNTEKAYAANPKTLNVETIKNYFNGQVGIDKLSGWCLKFCDDGYQYLGFDVNRKNSARQMADAYKNAGKLKTSRSPEVGAYVFFKGGSDGNGHVGVWVGDGVVATTGSGGKGHKIAKRSIAEWEKNYGAFRGWAIPTGLTVHYHTYSEEKIIKKPTASAKGSVKLICGKCGKAMNKEVPAIKDSKLRDGYYYISSKLNTKKCVSVAKDQYVNSGKVTLATKSEATSLMRLERRSDGSYSVWYNWKAVGIDVGKPICNNTTILTNIYGAFQRWYIVPVGDGWYKLENAYSYLNMDVTDSKTADGTRIRTRWDNGSNAQLFKLTLVSCTEHKWLFTGITKFPTYESTGQYTETCLYCKETRKKTIEKLKMIMVAWGGDGPPKPEVTLSETSSTFDGTLKEPTLTVKLQGKVLTEDTDYAVTYPGEMIFAGKYEYKIEFVGDSSYGEPVTVTYTIKKAKNPIVIKSKDATVKIKKKELKKKKQFIVADQYVTLKNAVETVTYKKTKGNKKITVNSDTGRITVKKGLKKGTYSVKIKVACKESDNFKGASKTVTVKVKVK